MEMNGVSNEWEYRVVSVPDNPAEAESAIGPLGDAAWELVSVASGAHDAGLLGFFRRPREHSVDSEAESRGATAKPASPAVEEPTTPDEELVELVLTSVSGDHAQLILAVTQARSALHLKDVKRAIESAPATLAAGLSEADAAELTELLVTFGATVDIRPMRRATGGDA